MNNNGKVHKKMRDGCIILKYLVVAYNMLENYFFQEIRLRVMKNQILSKS